MVDSYDDIVAKGAMKPLQTGKARQAASHAVATPIIRIPFCVTAMQEDSIGLYVEGQLAIKTTAGKDAYELLKWALSVGFLSALWCAMTVGIASPASALCAKSICGKSVW